MQPSKPPLLSFVMQLGHATIVTADLDSARRFFVDIAGFTEGARLPVFRRRLLAERKRPPGSASDRRAGFRRGGPRHAAHRSHRLSAR
ncbi:catechol 2,3-dioxygenase-like lactoylglutathione lyase family enzyme [Paraburkholderia sp. CI2]|nr:catechol 2,3-dioxygenase-like lactoylglutathione lyase family enzyme [Paraburkholderia sp. CI2]